MPDPDAKTAVQPQIETAKPGAFTPPRQIGPFELLRLLGRGGMAAVFEARHVKSKDKVALKVMDPNLRSDRTFVDRFLQEVKACATMEHPHVVKVLDHGEWEGWYFLATELIDGGTVADLITQMKQLPAPLAAELGAQLLDGLAYAHAQGIVHRDLKPENLLLTRDGVLKVADFGIARTADHTKLTKTGMLVGTAGYMSPEQAKGSSVDGRSDLFTVGIIFYEMLTGSNPFESDNPAASITRIIEQDVPPLFELRPTVPSELEAVVDRLLAGNPEERFDGASSAGEALEPLRAGHGRKLVADSIADPKAAKLSLDRELAAALVAEAKSSSQSNALESSRAALKLHFATLLDPENAEAKRRLDELAAKMKLRFGPSDNAKVKELEGALAFTPKNPMLLAQLANLHRLEGNLVRSASYLKRYLKLKPNDVYLSAQLTQLTGERRERVDKEPPPPSRSAPRLAPVVSPAPSPVPVPDLPPTTRSASEAGIFISRVEVEPPWLRATKRLAPWLALLLVAVLGGSWVSRQFDAAARDSERQADFIRKRLAQQSVDEKGRLRDNGALVGEAPAVSMDEAMRFELGGDFEHALESYDAMLRQGPSKPDAVRARFHRAKMLQALKRHADAREAYAQFLGLNPGSLDAAEALLRRGECAAVLEDAVAAEADFSEFLSRHPSSPLVLEDWVLRGELRARQRDVAGARADFRQVLDRLEPQAPLAKRAQSGLDSLPSK